jgi:hypothetical protein
MSEYGQPDFNYESMDRLASAVLEFPERFHPETQEIVLRHFTQTLGAPGEEVERVTQPTQTSTF